MDHRMRHFHPGRPAIGEYATGLGLKQRQEASGGSLVSRIELNRCGQLPFQRSHQLGHLGQVGTGDDHGAGAEDLVRQRGIGVERLCSRAEQRGGAAVRCICGRTGTDAPGSRTGIQCRNACSKGGMDRRGKHRRGCRAGQGGGCGGDKAIECKPLTSNDQPRIGAELPRT